MKRNVGRADKLARIVLGLAALVAGYFTGYWWLFLIAAVLLVTAFVGHCCLYRLFGVDTSKK